MTNKTILTMTQAERDAIRAKCEQVISESAEILDEGDVNQEQFSRICAGVANAAIVRAAITSWEEYE